MYMYDCDSVRVTQVISLRLYSMLYILVSVQLQNVSIVLSRSSPLWSCLSFLLSLFGLCSLPLQLDLELITIAIAMIITMVTINIWIVR